MSEIEKITLGEERFKDWYLTKTFLRTENISLGNDITYSLKVCDHKYKFIIPPKVEFLRGFGDEGKVEFGVISYSEVERSFGVFRYPVDEKGFFMAPISFEKTLEEVKIFSEKELESLIKDRKVLTFEAFRINNFGFQFFSISDYDFEEIEKLIGKDATLELQSSYKNELKSREDEVKEKILNLPNFLLILQNVLDQKYKNEKEISTMTNGIIHFGA
jgi:hypothetical protein